MQKIAQCQNDGWTPCKVLGGAEAIDLPDVIDPYVDFACTVLEWIIADEDHSFGDRFSAAMIQYSLAEHNSVLRGCFKPMVNSGDKEFLRLIKDGISLIESNAQF